MSFCCLKFTLENVQAYFHGIGGGQVVHRFDRILWKIIFRAWHVQVWIPREKAIACVQNCQNMTVPQLKKNHSDAPRHGLKCMQVERAHVNLWGRHCIPPCLLQAKTTSIFHYTAEDAHATRNYDSCSKCACMCKKRPMHDPQVFTKDVDAGPVGQWFSIHSFAELLLAEDYMLYSFDTDRPCTHAFHETFAFMNGTHSMHGIHMACIHWGLVLYKQLAASMHDLHMQRECGAFDVPSWHA